MRPFRLFVIVAACGGNSDVVLGPPPEGGPGDGMTADAAVLDVAKVPGLVQWLRGDIGVTADSNQRVSVWADHSGNGNDAFEFRNDPTVGFLEPTFVTSGINGLPCLHFSAQPTEPSGNDLLMNQQLDAGGLLAWGTSDYLVEVVARYDNDLSGPAFQRYGALYVNMYGEGDLLDAGPDAFPGMGLFANAPALGANQASTSILAFIQGQPAALSAGSGYNNDVPHAFAMRRVGTQLTVRVDGTVVASVDISPTTNEGSTGRLGGIENASVQRLDGDIAEVIGVKGPISASDLAGIEAYLRARYGLP